MPQPVPEPPPHPAPHPASRPAPQPASPAAPRPRIAVFGAGSIGCHLGGSLAPFASVTLIGRPEAMDTVRRQGLTLSGGGRPVTRVGPAAVRAETTPEAAAGAEYVLITVKSAATRDAARELAPYLAPGAVLVSFQNGLRNPEVIRAEAGDHPVLAGMVPYNVVQPEPGRYHQGSGGALMMDDAPAGGALAGALARAGLRVRTRSDMREVRHAKLLMNLNNAINALSGLPLRDELGQRAYRLCLALCQAEALAAFRAEGVRPARLGAIPATLMPRLLRLPDAVFTRLAASALAIDAEARSSTWDDLRRGRPTEIDSLQGEVVALAASHGLPAPVSARLVALVRQAESAGPEGVGGWTGAELLAELTAARTGSG